MACSQGCAVDWPLNTPRESDLYHCLVILQIPEKSKQILMNLCVNCSEKNPAFGYMWAILAAFNCHARTSDGAV